MITGTLGAPTFLGMAVRYNSGSPGEEKLTATTQDRDKFAT
jgi:hypothetical protein